MVSLFADRCRAAWYRLQMVAYVALVVLATQVESFAQTSGNNTDVLGPSDYGINFNTFAVNIATALGAVIATCLGLFFGYKIIRAGISWLSRSAH